MSSATQTGAARSSTADRFVELNDVSLTYASTDGVQKQAVANVSTVIRENEFVSIIGPSGCGKTTLIKVLGDLLQPSSGSVLIGGRHPNEIREERQIGYIFQSSVLLPWLTIRQNIEMLAKIAKRDSSTRHVDELIELVGLSGTAKRYPHELSGGMQQRAAIARALALDPKLLLMDEPFGALDEITRRRMNLELLEIWERRQKTVVFITHSIEEAVFLSDRVLVMATNPGRVVADVRIDLGRPRTGDLRFTPEMVELVAKLYHMLDANEADRLVKEGTA